MASSMTASGARGKFPNLININVPTSASLTQTNGTTLLGYLIKMLMTGSLVPYYKTGLDAAGTGLTTIVGAMYQGLLAVSNTADFILTKAESNTTFTLTQANVSKESALFSQINLNNKVYANRGDVVYAIAGNQTALDQLESTLTVTDIWRFGTGTATNFVFVIGTSKIDEDAGASTPVRIGTASATLQWIIQGKGTDIVDYKSCKS